MNGIFASSDIVYIVLFILSLFVVVFIPLTLYANAQKKKQDKEGGTGEDYPIPHETTGSYIKPDPKPPEPAWSDSHPTNPTKPTSIHDDSNSHSGLIINFGPKPWTCPVCENINESTFSTCQACGHRK